MPFTLAHPAAVLPLRRIRILRTVPLIIGAMTPDVPYFLPWRIAKHIPNITHTFHGTFTLCLPFGIALLAFCWLLRVPLAAPLWPRARAKCLRALERFGRSPRNWALAPLSLLIGSWTHIAWDSFTHGDGWMVLRVSALSEPVTIGSYTGPLYHALQYASSVFGLTVLAIWFWLLPAPDPDVREAERPVSGPVLIAVLLAIAAAAGGYESAEHLWQHGPADRYHLLYLLLTRTTAWFALLYTLAGILIVLARRRSAAPAAS
jgi:hypothetical protein